MAIMTCPNDKYGTRLYLFFFFFFFFTKMYNESLFFIFALDSRSWDGLLSCRSYLVSAELLKVFQWSKTS